MAKMMSARFIAKAFGEKAAWAYDVMKELGLVVKDKFGEWTLTDLGRQIGGRMSTSNYRPVPSFDFEIVAKMIEEHMKKT